MIRTILVVLAAAGASIAVPSLAADTAESPIYSVRFRLHGIETRGGGEPNLTARAGEPATMMIGNDSYTLRIVATTDADHRVDVDAEASVWTPEGLRYLRDDIALAADGEPGSFAFPATDPGTGERRDIRIEFSVVPLAD